MVTILCVDDENDMEMLVNQKFRKQIRDKQYSFVFANDGMEALAKIAEYPEIELVLSDINMPVMDGLAFLSKLKETNQKHIRIVMVSAYGDLGNIRAAMNYGAFDFVTKPIDLEDLEKTIYKTIDEIEVYNKFRKEHDKLLSMQADLSIAYEIQQAMLRKEEDPYPDIPEFHLHGMLEPAKSVGGDLFDYMMIDDEKLFFYIGDVSDKGIPAALYMAITKTLLKTAFFNNPAADLVTEVKKVNNLLAKDNPSLMFVTAFICILNIKTGMVEYVDCGHEQPVMVRSQLHDVEIIKKKNGGLPLSIQDEFPYTSNHFQLEPGDILFLYTDGLEDALNTVGERYKIDRNLALLKGLLFGETPFNINNIVMKEVKAYIGDANQFDDITLLTLKYNGKVS